MVVRFVCLVDAGRHRNLLLKPDVLATLSTMLKGNQLSEAKIASLKCLHVRWRIPVPHNCACQRMSPDLSVCGAAFAVHE